MTNQDQAKAGLAELRRGMDACLGLGMRVYQLYQQAVLAEAHLQCRGDRSDLMARGSDALATGESGVRFWEAELRRLKGTLLTHLAPGEPQEGRRYRKPSALRGTSRPSRLNCVPP